MDKKVREYSLGMKQRLGIAMALARQPRLLILDEPTNGLDPAGIEEIRELLRRLADGGVTVMVSSHLLGEIDKTATMLGILSQGRMIFQGTRDDLFCAATPDLLIDCSRPAARAVHARPCTTRRTPGGHDVRLPASTAMRHHRRRRRRSGQPRGSASTASGVMNRPRVRLHEPDRGRWTVSAIVR